MRSATAITSFSLWLMKTIDVPCGGEAADDARRDPPPPAGVSTAVGSSRTRMRASPVERLEDLDPLLPADRSRRRAPRIDRRGRSGLELAHTARAPRRRSGKAAGVRRLDGEHDVLGHGQRRDQHEVLVHHADAERRSRPSASRGCTGLPAITIWPSSAGTSRRGGSSASSCRRRSRRASAWTSPSRRSKSMSSLATVPGKRLVMWRISSTVRAASAIGRDSTVAEARCVSGEWPRALTADERARIGKKKRGRARSPPSRILRSCDPLSRWRYRCAGA